jgi:hypothetical protein
LPASEEEVKRLMELPVITAGFPAENNKSIQSVTLNGAQMFHAKIKFEKYNQGDSLASYTIPSGKLKTYGGQSGSPLWVKHGDAYVIIGVHIENSKAVIFNKKAIDWLNKKMLKIKSSCP